MGRTALAAFRLRLAADLIISHARPASRARRAGRAGASLVTGSQQKGPALKGFSALWPGFRDGGVQQDAMTTAALAEKGQVGFARLMRRIGMRVSVLYLGLARTARFALIDLEPG